MGLSALTLTGCGWFRGSSETPDPAPEPTPREVALERAVRWLRTQQGDDGAFRSQVYALFKEGQSLTPLLALALRSVAAPAPMVDRALAYVLSLPGDDGAVGFRTAIADYPVYATSLSLRALCEAKPTGWQEPAKRMAAWLTSQQLVEGWEDTPGYGGFTMGTKQPPQPPHAGHVDLSMTRRALQALHIFGHAPEHPAMQAGRHFVDRCSTEDGGFIYSPVEEALNKAGRTKAGSLRGYGSATCDGILALLALGTSRDDARLTRARSFLSSIHRPDENPGITDQAMQPYRKAMRGYYQAASAEVFGVLGGPDGWAAALEQDVLSSQQADGSWKNPLPLQKEDDPLVATALALLTLGAIKARSPAP